MKEIYTGLESSGKSLALARKSIQLINRNKRWFKKYKFLRPIYSNLTYSDKFYNKNKDFIKYFKDIRELLTLTGCDIIFDEISTHLSAMKKEPLSVKINNWLRQGAKQGVHIYATAQEFHDVHLDFRRRCFATHNFVKLIGSRRPGHNLPPVKYIWGICLNWNIKIHPYNELEPEKLSVIPGILFISRFYTDIFSTSQRIYGSDELPLEHIEKRCEKAECSYKKVIHR